MSNCKKTGGKIKKYDMGGMAKARPVPEGLLKEGGKRLADERRRMMMKGMSESLKKLRPPMENRKRRARSPLSDVGRAAIRGKEMAEKMKNLPKDSAEYARMKKAQEMAGAAMKAAPKRQAPSNMKKGGKVSSCSKRADGCATKGKTKGRMV